MQVTKKLDIVVRNFAYYEPSTDSIELYDLNNTILTFSNCTMFYTHMSFRILKLVKI